MGTMQRHSVPVVNSPSSARFCDVLPFRVAAFVTGVVFSTTDFGAGELESLAAITITTQECVTCFRERDNYMKLCEGDHYEGK
jgi:hypothetical protein